MNTVESSIRNAIARSAAHTPEARNVVYLSAKSAIEKLPAGQLETAMAQLFKAVEAIETEYARAELAAGQLQDGPAAPPAEPLGTRARKILRQQGQTLKRLPWRTLLVLVVLAAIMALSILLLVQQYRNAGLISRAPSADTLLSQGASTADDSGETRILFAFRGRQDLARISVAPGRRQALVPAPGDDPSSPHVLLPQAASLYAGRSINLLPDRLHLLRFRLRIEPAESKVMLKAGFAAAPASALSDSETKPEHDFIIHDGMISPQHPREDGNILLFTRLFDTTDLASGLRSVASGWQVTPAITIEARSPGTRIWFVSLSVEAI